MRSGDAGLFRRDTTEDRDGAVGRAREGVARGSAVADARRTRRPPARPRPVDVEPGALERPPLAGRDVEEEDLVRPDPDARDEAELRQPRESVHGAGLGRESARPSIGRSASRGRGARGPRSRRGRASRPARSTAREPRPCRPANGARSTVSRGSREGQRHVLMVPSEDEVTEDRTAGRVRRELKVVHEEVVGARALDDLRAREAPDGDRLVVGRRRQTSARTPGGTGCRPCGPPRRERTRERTSSA